MINYLVTLIFLFKNTLSTVPHRIIAWGFIEAVSFAFDSRVISRLFRFILEVFDNRLHGENVIAEIGNELFEGVLDDRYLYFAGLSIFLKVVVELLKRLFIVLLIYGIVSD